MELEEYSTSQKRLWFPQEAEMVLTTCPAQKGHFALSSGAAEVSVNPGKASAVSQGGYAVGGHQDASGGWNIAGAGPGMGFGQSESGRGSTGSPYYLEDGGTQRESSGNGPAAALAAVGGATAVGVPQRPPRVVVVVSLCESSRKGMIGSADQRNEGYRMDFSTPVHDAVTQ